MVTKSSHYLPCVKKLHFAFDACVPLVKLFTFTFTFDAFTFTFDAFTFIFAFNACTPCQTVVGRNYGEQNFFEGSHTPPPTYCHASSS